MSQTIQINRTALEKNQKAADQNRAFFIERKLLACNMISSPGSGKTALLERMGERYGKSLAVINGDVQMSYDAERIEKSGARAIQIETGGSCHLTAEMVQKALKNMDLDGVEILVIENVGNLVCPSGFDLGEHFKAALVSVTEGDEKPMKYPALFTRAKAVVINKTDLLPFVSFSLQRVREDCRKLNSSAEIFEISCKAGKGLEAWFLYLEKLKNAPAVTKGG